jgi:hypothetical protein
MWLLFSIFRVDKNPTQRKIKHRALESEQNVILNSSVITCHIQAMPHKLKLVCNRDLKSAFAKDIGSVLGPADI